MAAELCKRVLLEAPWSSGRTLALDAARARSIPWEARIIRCKNLALYIRDCESLCLSDETVSVKAVGPFYLVTMPGEVKDPTQGVNVSWTPHSNLEKDNSLKTTQDCVSPKMGCLEYTK